MLKRDDIWYKKESHEFYLNIRIKIRKGWRRVGNPPSNTKTKWKLWYMWLPHSTTSPIYGHWPKSGSPQRARVLLRPTVMMGSSLVMSGRTDLSSSQRQRPAWPAPIPTRISQQGSAGFGNPTTSCTTFNAHSSKSGHVWEVTIESERRFRERNRATQTLPFKPISRNKPNSFTTLSYTFLCYRLWIINNSTPGTIYSPKTSALRI